jgi:ATP-dependent DNA helicase PIF1
LPPIDDSYCFESEAWSFINSHHELTTIKRQNQEEFKTFLSHVRLGKLNREDKQKFDTLCRHSFPTTTHLFYSNKEAEEFNEYHLKKLVESTGNVPVELQCKIDSNQFEEDEIDSFFRDRHQLYKTLFLCEGATCMLTANLDVQNGWCNGTLGTIHSIKNGQITMKNKAGQIMLIPTRIYKREKRRVECDVVVSKGKKRFCGQTDCYHTPVYQYLDDELKDQPEHYLHVTQYPLLLAWGITIHKSQGMSLDSCTITLPFTFSPSLIYVALSRCVSFDSLCIKTNGPIRYDQICPSQDVMKHIFQWKEAVCKICNETYLGPYSAFCQDCCSAPGKYSMYRFIDFIPQANPSPSMQDYRLYALKNPTKASTTRWKKFITFCKGSFFE